MSTSQPVSSPRGWHRPISRAQLLLVSLTLLIAWLAVMGLAAWGFWHHWEARLVLRDQAMSVALPAGLRAQAEVSSPLVTRIDLHPSIEVALDQTLMVALQDSLSAHTTVHTVLPVDTTVDVSQDVPVDTVATLHVPLVKWLPAFTVDLPLKLTMPVRLRVPFKAEVPVDLDMVVTGTGPASLPVPVRAKLALRPHVQGRIEARVTRRADFSLMAPVPPIEMRLTELGMAVPLRDLGVVLAP